MELALERLGRIREAGIWPNGPRDLWTDALGVLFLTSLHRQSGDGRFLDEAEWVAQEVDRVLGRRRGIRMGESSEARGQSYRSLALWIFALNRLGRYRKAYLPRAMSLVREIHAPFVRPGAGIISRMEEDLRAPYPGSGPGKLEVLMGLAVYRSLDPGALRPEIEELEGLVRATYLSLAPDHGVDLGLLLWITHFFPEEAWSLILRERALAALDARWVDPPGYFRRNLPEPWSGPVRPNRLAITNLTASIGLQAQGVWTHRVQRMHRYFLSDYPWEAWEEDPLSPILTCVSLYPGLLIGP
ncbi:hypothetical protein ACFL5A_03220 [Gemmatimonadota bacterium]